MTYDPKERPEQELIPPHDRIEDGITRRSLVEKWVVDAIEARARSRFREEVVEALEDVPSHIKEPASSNGIFYDEASFNAGYRLAKQKSIETIKKL